ncbi:MAG: TonB-dependent receptor [Gemmatimonadales bacterium]|jgi:iron complex outermembrane receptor protein
MTMQIFPPQGAPMRRSAGAFVTLAFLLLPSLALAQNGVIRGHVADSTGAPLAHAAVTVDGQMARTSTNDQGAYELRGVPAGTWTLRARALGYRPGSVRVTVTAGGVARQDISLASQPISVAAIDVVVGSHAQHVAADELAVPVDVFPAALLAQQGTSETSQILQAVAPSVNFPHQSVTDATDIARPFTLRGLSPDHTLVLLDGWRRHQMAVVNTFAYGTAAGSSGVDMNAIPAAAIEHIEVLRDGASAQYGSDAIAGVINLVTKQGRFSPFMSADAGEYVTSGYPVDGTSVDVNGGVGLGLGRGSLALFGEFQNRQPTNRAWADPYDDSGNGQTDSVSATGKVIVKRNGVPQPNQHWGDGLERDVLTLANLRMPLNAGGTTELFGLASYSFRVGTGFGYRRYSSSDRNWPSIYPFGFLPEYHPDVTDYSATMGVRGAFHGWGVEFGGTFGHNDFRYNLENTLNQSLGPSLVFPQNAAGIPNQTSFFAGKLARDEFQAALTASRTVDLGLPAPVSVAAGAAFRWERFIIGQGELASYVNGGDTTQSGGDPIPGSQVFPGFSPADASSHSRTNVGVYADLETNLTRKFLANAAGRFESYSDFGQRLTGKLAFRYQPTSRITLRAAASTGFRAPGLGQAYFSKVITNVIAGVTEDIGVFPVNNPAAVALGAKPLRDETSVNLSTGIAVTPWENLTVTADYFYILLKHRIVLGATYDDDTTRAILTRNGYPNIAGVQYFTNGIDTRTQGVDLNATLRLPDVGGGAIDLTAAANYTKTRIVHIEALPAVLQFSPHGGLLDTVTTLAIERERPDWRGTLTAQYTRGGLHGLVRGSYYGGFRSAQPGYCDQCGEFYGARTLVDVEVGYRLGAADLSIGVRNLFDVYPAQPHTLTPIDPTDPSAGTAKDYNSNYATFPWAAASPFGYNGRNLYSRLRITLP